MDGFPHFSVAKVQWQAVVPGTMMMVLAVVVVVAAGMISRRCICNWILCPPKVFVLKRLLQLDRLYCKAFFVVVAFR